MRPLTFRFSVDHYQVITEDSLSALCSYQDLIISLRLLGRIPPADPLPMLESYVILILFPIYLRSNSIHLSYVQIVSKKYNIINSKVLCLIAPNIFIPPPSFIKNNDRTVYFLRNRNERKTQHFLCDDCMHILLIEKERKFRRVI